MYFLLYRAADHLSADIPAGWFMKKPGKRSEKYVMDASTGISTGGSTITPESIAQFRRTILSYYAENRRDLPWRHTTDPYHILVSEIMLQQTQVARVMTKYPEFISAFPAFADLARAPLSSVLAVWQGMGYNRRAMALKTCAQKVMDEFNGELPSDTGILATFPGIGKATAGSIAAFAFNMPVVFIETNIRRVFIHFFFDEKSNIPDTEILPLAGKALEGQDPRTWYSALMDYGTMLRGEIQNPNRRSAHYARQTKFEGSDREIRGQIIRTLIKEQELDETILAGKFGSDPERVYRILGTLEKEGYLIRSNGSARLSE